MGAAADPTQTPPVVERARNVVAESGLLTRHLRSRPRSHCTRCGGRDRTTGGGGRLRRGAHEVEVVSGLPAAERLRAPARPRPIHPRASRTHCESRLRRSSSCRSTEAGCRWRCVTERRSSPAARGRRSFGSLPFDRESGIGNRESGIGNRESGIGNRNRESEGCRAAEQRTFTDLAVSVLPLYWIDSRPIPDSLFPIPDGELAQGRPVRRSGACGSRRASRPSSCSRSRSASAPTPRSSAS